MPTISLGLSRNLRWNSQRFTRLTMPRVTRRTASRKVPISSDSEFSPLSSAVSDYETTTVKDAKYLPPERRKNTELLDPEAEAEIPAAEEEVKEASSRPPAVNSGYLPLPWIGRLGYVCRCQFIET